VAEGHGVLQEASDGARQQVKSHCGAAVVGLLFLALVGSPAFAQWLKIPLAGTPRKADGSPDLTAPAPRTSDGKMDLSGIWGRPYDNTPVNNIAEGLEVLFQPWGQARYKERQANNGKGTPSEQCLPHGITKAMSVHPPFKVLQTPTLIVILHEEFNHYRQIFMDGRRAPANRRPTYFGYSLGKWDGDTLVVDTTGFVDDSWIDFSGHPGSDTLHIVERYRRRDFGHLDIQFTIDDAKAYAKPWTVTIAFELLPDTELIEHICDNEKDAEHIVGKVFEQPSAP
jgi:hypothetical protein